MIDTPDGARKAIEAIAPGDIVMAFDRAAEGGRGKLVPARVRRVFRNLTTELLVLSSGLVVTPGHLFLNERGACERADEIFARGGRIVRADGELESVDARKLVYGESACGLYEEAEEGQARTLGALALRPEIERGWRTYNFEVELLHTYVAGGYRVHNDSLGDMISAEEQYQDDYGVAWDPNDAHAVDQLAADIASHKINGGSLTAYYDLTGDLTTLKAALVKHDDMIADKLQDADGNTILTDSNGEKFIFTPDRTEVGNSYSDGNGGRITETFGYSSNGTEYVASVQDVNNAGVVVASITNVTDPTTGVVQSSTETDYNSSGVKTQTTTRNADDSAVETAYAADGSQAVSTYDTSGSLTLTQTYDASGKLTSESGVTALGIAWTETFDAAGNPTVTLGGKKIDFADAAVAGAEALGSSLGKALGGNSLAAQIGEGTVLGTFSEALAFELFAKKGALALGDNLNDALTATFSKLGAYIEPELLNVASGDIAALLMADLAHELHLKGFEAGLFDSVGTTITAQLMQNIANAAKTAGAGGNSAAIEQQLFQNFDPSKLAANLAGAVGAFMGSYLAERLVKARDGDGVIGGEVGSAVGSAIASALLTAFIGPLAPFVGSFLGDILGTKIGDAFEGPPKANAEVGTDRPGQAIVTGVTTKNGGSADLVVGLATATANAINALLNEADAAASWSGAIINFSQKKANVEITYVDGTIYYDPAQSTSQTWADVLDGAVMNYLRNTPTGGSDIIKIAALGEALARETGSVDVSTDLTIAQDYENYLANKDAINALIKANPLSSFAAGWELTLLEAKALGLTDLTPLTGETAQLANNVETIMDASGAVVESIRFNSDGTRSVFKGAPVSYQGNGQTVQASNEIIEVTPLNFKHATRVTNWGMVSPRTWGSISTVGWILWWECSLSVDGDNDSIVVSPDAVEPYVGGMPVMISVAGDNDSVTLGMGIGGVTLTSGHGAVVYESNDTASISANVTGVVINGRGNAITIAGSGVTLSATNNTLTAAANISFALTGNNNTISLGTGDTLTLTGTGDSITTTGSAITLNGDGSNIVVNGSNNTLTLTETGASVTASGDKVNILSGLPFSLTGSNDTVTAATGSSATINGSNDTLNLAGTGGSTAQVTGSNDIVNATGATLTIGAGSSATINGASNVINVGDNSSATLNGGSNKISLGASDIFVFEPGFGQDEISNFSAYDSGATHETISLPTSEFADFAAFIAGARTVGSDTIVTAANGDQLTLAGVTAAALSKMSGDFVFHH